jgi:hypothetical protein
LGGGRWELTKLKSEEKTKSPQKWNWTENQNHFRKHKKPMGEWMWVKV